MVRIILLTLFLLQTAMAYSATKSEIKEDQSRLLKLINSIPFKCDGNNCDAEYDTIGAVITQNQEDFCTGFLSVDAKSGWIEVDDKIGQYIKNNPLPVGASSSHPVVQRRNMIVHFFTDSLATLIWNQYNINDGQQTYTLSKDTRIMEKINGQWMIVNVASFWDYKNLVPVDSLK